MCLTFILGDIKDEFNNPFKSMRSLFSAILGELDWEPFDDGTNVNDAVLAFAYFVYIIYIIIGSLVLLNLLIAMMLKHLILYNKIQPVLLYLHVFH